ncbi:hypothetical protein F2Q69_00018965 [Brassica cretica]|uniref:GPI inositol-deacylase n=1 Tax=Brassica cretica TaxID=69181 RepID=A0A8S9QN23_BRACR|nr:hypothetical protein F2Q69_00018965 [Brassica cretica]
MASAIYPSLRLRPTFSSATSLSSPCSDVWFHHFCKGLSLIGHSAGGWLARVYMEEYGTADISLLLTLVLLAHFCVIVFVENVNSGLWGWQCKASAIAKENCALRCLSPVCYELIYESDPLEEGEKDLIRSQEYKYCMYKSSLGESLDGVRGSFL